MKGPALNRYLLATAVLLLAALSCTSYKSREVAFRHPSAYGNVQSVAGAQVAAQMYEDTEEARKAFGFDIRSTGILPVQVIVDNTGTRSLEVVPDQTFLIDRDGGMWNMLDRQSAYERLEKSTEYARIARGAGRGTMLGAAGGALFGAAIGVLTGDFSEAALKGAAVGAAGGAIAGGARGASDQSEERRISRDLASKQLRNKPIKPGDLGRGFLFFPGEAISASNLRLQFRLGDSAETRTVNLSLQRPAG